MTDMYENIGYRSIGPKYCINELLTRSTIEHRNNKLEKKTRKIKQEQSFPGLQVNGDAPEIISCSVPIEGRTKILVMLKLAGLLYKLCK